MTRDGECTAAALEKCIWAGHLVARDETRRHLQPRKTDIKRTGSLLSSHFPLDLSPHTASCASSAVQDIPRSPQPDFHVTLEKFRHERRRRTNPDVELAVTVEALAHADDAPTLHGDVGAPARRSRPVDDRSPTDHELCHARTL